MSVTPDEDLFLILKDLPTLSYSQQYSRWSHFLSELQKNSSANLISYLEMFLDRFPFTLTHWLKLIFLKPKSQVTTLSKNPRCPELWKLYLEVLKEANDPGYKKELERAIQDIGSDLNSCWLFQEYSGLVTETHAKYQFFKKLFTRPILKLQQLMEKFKEWLKGLSAGQLQAIYYRETKDDKNNSNHSQYILGEITKTHKNTLSYREKRVGIESQIKHFYFSDAPERQDEIQLWRKYILLERSHYVVDNICYVYERALNSHTQNLQLWQEVFHYLENQTGKHLRLLTILRDHKGFFLNFNHQLYFYWCNLEERDNPSMARKMYQDLEEYKKIGEIEGESLLHVHLRHIQFEIRSNELLKAKTIYDSLLPMHQGNSEVLSYIVVEYANFIITRFKEMQFAKNLYSVYFSHMNYNRYLFVNYLEFMRYFENDEGYYDQLMDILVEGYKKAAVLGEKDRIACLVQIKSHLRVSLGSINLIKITEKKFYDLQKQTKEDLASKDPPPK